jgi:hypothetical protein
MDICHAVDADDGVGNKRLEEKEICRVPRMESEFLGLTFSRGEKVGSGGLRLSLALNKDKI